MQLVWSAASWKKCITCSCCSKAGFFPCSSTCLLMTWNENQCSLSYNVFTHVAGSHAHLLERKKALKFISNGIGLQHQHRRCFIVSETNMAAMTSWRHIAATHSSGQNHSLFWFFTLHTSAQEGVNEFDGVWITFSIMSKKSWHFWESTIWHKSRRICTATLRTVTSWSSAIWFRYGNTADSSSSSYKGDECTIKYRSPPPGQKNTQRIVQLKSGWFRSQRSRPRYEFGPLDTESN